MKINHITNISIFRQQSDKMVARIDADGTGFWVACNT